MNLVYTVGDSRVPILTVGNRGALSLRNLGTATVYLDSQTDVTPQATPLLPGDTGTWQAGQPCYATCAQGLSSSLAVSDTLGMQGVGQVSLSAPVSITGPVTVSGTVNIGTMPAVALSQTGTNNNVVVANTSPISISGNVTASGTVNIGTMPAVALSQTGTNNNVVVANTSPISISGNVTASGTVNIGTMPAVALSQTGTNNNVVVANTSPISISGNVTASGTVNIGTMPAVALSQTGTNNNVVVANTSPISISGNVTASGTVNIGTMPAVALSQTGTNNNVVVANTSPISISGNVTASGTVNIGTMPAISISQTGTNNNVAISGTVNITGPVNVTSGTVNIGGQPVGVTKAQQQATAQTIPIGNSSTTFTVTPASGAQSLIVTVTGFSSNDTLSDIQVKGHTTQVIYYDGIPSLVPDNYGQSAGLSFQARVQIDTGNDSSYDISVKLVTTATATIHIYVTSSLDPLAMTVSGDPSGSPVITGVSTRVRTISSLGQTTSPVTVLAGASGVQYRIHSGWTSGHGTSGVDIVSALEETVNGTRFHESNGITGVSSPMDKQGLVLPAGAGVRLVFSASGGTASCGFEYEKVNTNT